MIDPAPRFVSALALEERPLEPGLARVQGSLGARAVSLTTHAFVGPGVRHARAATLAGEGLRIVNLLALPEGDLPVLGVNVVWTGGDSTLVVADISPPGPPPPAHGLPSAGELPAWARRALSAHAVFARVPRGRDAEAEAAIAERIETWASLVRGAAPGPRGDYEGYLAAHREDERLLGPLRAAFGAEWLARYLDEVLFPQSEPVTTSRAP